MKMYHKLLVAAGATAVILAGCGGGDSSQTDTTYVTPDDPNDPVVISGTKLDCRRGDSAIVTSYDASDLHPLAPDSIPAYNISREAENVLKGVAESQKRPNAGNNLKRLVPVTTPKTPDGLEIPADEWAGEEYVHPVMVSYTEQVLGDYELGDGSADIGDPNHVDDTFVSLSLDNGKSWKKYQVGDTASRSSIEVSWDLNRDGERETIEYPGHSHKSTNAPWGKNILVAWLDKYCPSGNPYDLVVDEDGTYPDDTYQINGTQGSIDYDLPCTNPTADPESDEYDCAPNGKPVYQVPFSCVWIARGVLDPYSGQIAWRKEEQLTSGRRDAHKIWIAAEDVGFAMAWQEDPEGMRSGKGEGPGDGWSGATSNHGTDIWYTYIRAEDFDDVLDPIDPENLVKPKPAIKMAMPVRITDNEICLGTNNGADDPKPYCALVCTDSTTVDPKNNKYTDGVSRCITGDIDQLDGTDDVLDGDTGASRPALAILQTNGTVPVLDELGEPTGETEPEYITILGYEETKGLLEDTVLDPTITDIALEGKAVYFESFLWNDPVKISAGNIVNKKSPRYDPDGIFTEIDNGEDIWQNARRLVIMNQVDACEMSDGDYTFGFLYKESYDTQGAASDMFIRMNKGFAFDTFEPVDGILNVSATRYDASVTEPSLGTLDLILPWDVSYMQDLNYVSPYDNTFSPRGFLRGDEIYTGYAYTPSWERTTSGQEPTNFWINRYVDDGDGLKWHGPQQITFEKGGESALDPRLVATPESRYGENLTYDVDGNKVNTVLVELESDKSNPDILFMAYNTANTEVELDVFYSRSTDKGKTWEMVRRDNIPVVEGEPPGTFAHMSTWPEPIEEKEVQSLPSPNGGMFFNVWLQESETEVVEGVPDEFVGLESWLGRVDYTELTEPEDFLIWPVVVE